MKIKEPDTATRSGSASGAGNQGRFIWQLVGVLET